MLNRKSVSWIESWGNSVPRYGLPIVGVCLSMLHAVQFCATYSAIARHILMDWKKFNCMCWIGKMFNCHSFTRNAHAHLCLTPVRRLRARVIKCGCRWVARGMCYVCEFAVEAVWCCSIQAAMAPRPWPPSPSPKNNIGVKCVWMC